LVNEDPAVSDGFGVLGGAGAGGVIAIRGFYIQFVVLAGWDDGDSSARILRGRFMSCMGRAFTRGFMSFEKAKAVTPYLRVGNVRVKKIELLERGGRYGADRVGAGKAFIRCFIWIRRR